jgi:hypothetical protein
MFENKKLVLEGILHKIKSVEQKEIRRSDGPLVVGGHNSSSVSGYKTLSTIIIQNSDSEQEIKYYGIILPDSIGNKLQVYHELVEEQKRLALRKKLGASPVIIEKQDNLLYDTILDRWYK